MARKKNQELSQSYRKPLLFLDDVEELCNIFSECSDSVTIEAGGYEYESLKDFLDNHQGDSRDFAIKTGGLTGISARLCKSGLDYYAKLSSWDDSNDRVAAFYKADKVMKKASREVWLDKLFWPLCYLASLFVGFLANELTTSEPLASSYVLGLVVLCCWSFFSISRFFQQQKMVFRRRHESPSFWVRKKDELLLLVIGAILGTCLSRGVPKLYDAWQQDSSFEKVISSEVGARQEGDDTQKAPKVISVDEAKK